MRDLLLYLLAAVGAITVSAAAALMLFGVQLQRKHQRVGRARRDQRARALKPEHVTGQEGLAVWLEFVRDHDLHKIQPPKEDT
ncbi:hypothetical protein [Nonomuraea wenchangensis]|uniref:hypothetical protein n=1 Tax=Nonomuraea wenchangensis TaxID=568860 RepID=UPI003325ED14